MPHTNVLAIDLLGHGRTEGPGRQSIEEYAQDVIAFMDAFGIKSAALAGVSMGGAISMTIALKHPERVPRLALLGSGAKMRVSPAILDSLRDPSKFESAVEMINSNCFGPNTPQNIVQLSKRAMLEMKPPALLGDFLACDRFDVTDELSRIQQPVLVICGSEDKMTPLKYSQYLHDSIQGSRLQVVDGAGHLVMTERPDEVATYLFEFTRSLSPLS